MTVEGQTTGRNRSWRWAALGVFAFVVVAATVWLVHCINQESDTYIKTQGPWDGQPTFVATVDPSLSPPPNATFTARLLFAWRKFQMRHAKRTFSFMGGPAQTFSVAGLLNQCMRVTGTRYLLARDVVSVDFGHTNTLTGPQWVAAIEHTLQHDRPYCFNPQSKRMYQDNLLLIREKPGHVKVVPRSQLGAYQKAGLVSPKYVPPSE